MRGGVGAGEFDIGEGGGGAVDAGVGAGAGTGVGEGRYPPMAQREDSRLQLPEVSKAPRDGAT